MKILPITFRNFILKGLLNPVAWICWIILVIFLVFDFRPFPVFSIFITFVCFFNFIPYYLIKELESRFRVAEGILGGGPSHILVLGGGHIPDSEILIEQQLNNSSLRRVLEGVRLHNKNNSLLIMSGKSLRLGHPSQAEIQSKVACSMGIKIEKIKVISEPSNTEEEALFYFRDFGFHNKQIFIVTKALHLRRALFIFSSYGYNVIPAPSYFIHKNYQPNIEWFIVPDFSLVICFGEYLKEIFAYDFLKIQCYLRLKYFPSEVNSGINRRTSFEIINR